MVETLTITRHAIRNYGSVLQAYATQKLLNSLGVACTTIDYRQPGVSDTARTYRPRPVRNRDLGRDLIYRAFRAHGARARGAVFERFLRDELNLTPDRFDGFDALVRHEWPEGALYCVGSDQVWNLDTNSDNRPYYLSFAPERARKFSLASSIGMSRLPPTQEGPLVEALQGFAGVSVRESDAAAYLNSLGVPAVCHVDPVLAVPKEEWQEFSSEVPRRRHPYVLVYQLNSNSTLQRAAVAVGRELGLPVVRVEYWQTFRGHGAETVMRPSVAQFVALIRDAAVLVSDSFHGAAFALALGTFVLSMEPPKYEGRLSSLMGQFGLEHLRVSSVGTAIDAVRQSGGLPDVAGRLEQEREKVRRYLATMVQMGSIDQRRQEQRA